MDKLTELIRSGETFNFENNSQRSSSGEQYGKASDELLGWAASVEDFIHGTYGQESAAFKLYQTFARNRLTGYYKSDFERQMTILNGALKACKNMSPRKPTIKQDDHEVVRLIKNPYFWTVLVVVIGSAFVLGLNFGSSRFDKEKLEFYEQTIDLNKELREIQKSNVMKDSTISNMTKRMIQLQDSLKIIRKSGR